ncbi:MAG TPA: SAM-dependent methyltransferase [Gammaproteobacteria bacterium]|nr:SAM-dependent methyltransferase [Gammaproteobacteria bacterium]
MELALYAPGLGYYSAGRRRFGIGGDFITAPELSPLFARCLARQCVEILEGMEDGVILEFGAGSGVLARELLAALEALDVLPAAYFILEPSAALREEQEATLRKAHPRLMDRIHWLTALPREGLRGIVLANEVLDAMPVHRLRWRNGAFVELYVDAPGEEGLTLVEGPLSHPALEAAPRRFAGGFPEGYTCEVNPAAGAWVRSLSGVLAEGVALLIDYGYPAAEYYHPQRRDGTLMCYYRHRAHDDPLCLPGLQDITAHVDFTALAEAAVDAGLEVAGYATQSAFLQGCGIAELGAAAMSAGDTRQQVELARQLRTLLLPGEMGEAFKVLALARKRPGPLTGFSVRDERGRLAPMVGGA